MRASDAQAKSEAERKDLEDKLEQLQLEKAEVDLALAAHLALVQETRTALTETRTQLEKTKDWASRNSSLCVCVCGWVWGGHAWHCWPESPDQDERHANSSRFYP